MVEKPKQNVLEMLNKQYTELNTIIQSTQSARTYDQGVRRMQRWCNRTSSLIGEHLSEREATAFQWMEENAQNDPKGHFTTKAKHFRGALLALIDEIDTYEQRFIGHTNITRQPEVTSQYTGKVDSRKVFVVYGRNLAVRNAMFDFLRALGLTPLEWSQATHLAGMGTPSTKDVVDAGLRMCRAVIVLFSGDDEAQLRPIYQEASDHRFEKQLTPQPRPNVLFEAGLAFGLYPTRTILVEIGCLRPMSDIQGLQSIRLADTAEIRTTLKDRLVATGCKVNATGTDWLSSGDFTAALSSHSV